MKLKLFAFIVRFYGTGKSCMHSFGRFGLRRFVQIFSDRPEFSGGYAMLHELRDLFFVPFRKQVGILLLHYFREIPHSFYRFVPRGIVERHESVSHLLAECFGFALYLRMRGWRRYVSSRERAIGFSV